MNRKGHGMSFPIWVIWLVQLGMIFSWPFYGLSYFVGKEVATLIFICLAILQVWLAWKFGFKTLIPLALFIVYGWFAFKF